MSIVGWALDEIVSAMYRNSAHGPPPEHWYPPKEVRDALHLQPHQCACCKGFDVRERRITTPFCPGRPYTPAKEGS